MPDRSRRLFRPRAALRTERLHLRPWTAGDVGALLAAWQDPEIIRWTAVPDVADPAAAASVWIERNPQMVALNRSLDLAIAVRGEVVGEVGLVVVDEAMAADARVELGWWLFSEHRGIGLAAEAVTLFTDFVLAADGLGFGAAYAVCADANPASGAVARGAGFARCDRPAPAGQTVWRRVGTEDPTAMVHL